MRFDDKLVASAEFMLNLNYIMLTLCEPIISKDLKTKLDPLYFLIDQFNENRSILNWKDCTRMSGNINDEIKDNNIHKSTKE